MSYSYSYKSSSSNGGSAMPSRIGNDAEFQAAKMQAMMGTPMVGGGGNTSYSYQSSSSSSAMPSRGVHVGGGLVMDAEMERMKREMERGVPSNMGGGSNSYSYHSESSSGTAGGAPRVIPLHEDGRAASSGGTTVKKVVTTTTTKTNPEAVRQLESLERDFSRIGRTPDNYHDDFEKIKKEIVTGEAYQGAVSTQQPASAKYREEYTKTSKSAGSAAPRLIPVSTGAGGGSSVESTTTTRTYTSGSGGPSVTEEKVVKTFGGLHQTTPSTTVSETYIPINTYDNTFDDFHMNRWMDHKDHFDSFASHDLDTHRMDWENRLGGMKSGFFSFPTHHDMMPSTSTTIDSSRTVAKNPLGKPEFSVQFEMKNFKPADIAISTRGGKLIIKATHEEKSGSSTSKREFSRTVDLPADVQINLMRSVYSRDGILSITAPIKPPQYNPRPLMSTYSSTQSNHNPEPPQRSTASSTHSSPPSSVKSAPARAPLARSPSAGGSQAPTNGAPGAPARADQRHYYSFHEPVIGYNPEDITVTLTGRKVKVHAKHVETTPAGRRIHNEFTKMFDLPANYGTVECYIKDERVLYIVPYLRDDIEGSFVFISIDKK